MRCRFTTACCFLLTVFAAGDAAAQDSAPGASTALLVEVKDAIGPATKEHFLSGLARAEEERMQLVVLVWTRRAASTPRCAT